MLLNLFITVMNWFYIWYRYAVVTGANKGIGFGICKQLASKGITVVLTARDEKRGLEAVEKLKEFGPSDHVVFHQLDVTDPNSIASLANFIKTQFGKLDILVCLSFISLLCNISTTHLVTQLALAKSLKICV